MRNKKNIMIILLYVFLICFYNFSISCINDAYAKNYGMKENLVDLQEKFVKQDKVLDYCNKFSSYTNKEDLRKHFKDFISSYDDTLLKETINLYNKKYSLCKDTKSCLDTIADIWVTNNTFNKLFCGKLKYIIKGDEFVIEGPIYYPRLLQLINNLDNNFGRDTIFFIERNKCKYQEKSYFLTLGLGYVIYMNGKNYIGYECNKNFLSKADFHSLFMNINSGFLKNLSHKNTEIFCYKTKFNNFLVIESDIDKKIITNVTPISGFDEKSRKKLCAIYNI